MSFDDEPEKMMGNMKQFPKAAIPRVQAMTMRAIKCSNELCESSKAPEGAYFRVEQLVHIMTDRLRPANEYAPVPAAMAMYCQSCGWMFGQDEAGKPCTVPDPRKT
jgi:hypothetical protein